MCYAQRFKSTLVKRFSLSARPFNRLRVSLLDPFLAFYFKL
jgi:hypothetical protein